MVMLEAAPFVIYGVDVTTMWSRQVEGNNSGSLEDCIFYEISL